MTRSLQALFWVVAAAAGCGDNGEGVDIVVPTLDFGATDCGTAAVPRVLTITNESGKSFTYTTSLAKGAESMYTVTPASAAVLPYSQVSVMVISRPIPAESALTEDLYGDTLTVTTDRPGDTPREVAITQSARGFVLETASDAVNFASPVLFGSVAELPLMVTNTGTAAAEVAATSTLLPFSADPVVIAPGATVAMNVKFSPGHTGDNVGRLQLTASGASCGGTLAPEIRVSGVGSAKGLASRVVPAVSRPRPDSAGGMSGMCALLTTKHVACGGVRDYGMRGAPTEYLDLIDEPDPGKGKSGPSGGLPNLDIVNLVQAKGAYLDDVVQLVSGTGFYCARRSGGDVWCWGDYRGIGGNGDQTLRTNATATRILSSGATDIAAGYMYRCILEGGQVTCRTQRTGQDEVQGVQNFQNATAVATSGATSYMLVGGEVWAAGFNYSGERGDPEVGNEDPPNKVPSLTGITQVVAGGRANRMSNRFGCARKDDGTLWCWGSNSNGQLADGTYTSRAAPAQPIDSLDAPLAGVTSVTAGYTHACAVVAGSVYCWGRGQEGQIGNENIADSLRAAQVTGLSNVSSIESAGTYATCAMLSNNGVRCWGEMFSTVYSSPQPLFVFEP